MHRSLVRRRTNDGEGGQGGAAGVSFFFVSGNCAVHAIVCGNLVVVMLEWQFSLVAVVVGVAIWLQ